MSRYIHVAIGLVLVVVLSGCSGGLFADLGENIIPPVVVTPNAVPFAAEEQITLSWDEDPGADLYLLYRDDTSTPLVPTLIYVGEATSYVDTDVVANRNYYYRLAKRRGDRIFGPSDFVYAVATDTRQEASEPNDQLTNAAQFVDGVAGTLHGFQDGLGSRLIDQDCYRTTVPGNHRLIVRFAEATDFTSGDVDVSLIGDGVQPIDTNGELRIENYSLQPQVFFFCFTINESNFFSGAGAGAASGGAVGGYRLRQADLGSLTLP